MAIEAVIFDWGGTLSVYADMDLADMWRMAAKRFDPEREDEIVDRLVAVENASWDRVHSDQRSTTLAQLLREASADLGLDVTQAVLDEAATDHLDSWTPHIRHDPDAEPLLRTLQERGLRVGLLSNTHWPRSFHQHFLERDGLADLIEATVYTSELHCMKPHPDAFKTVLRLLDVHDPRNAVFVGDRPYDDIWGAGRLGMLTVLRPNPAVDAWPDGQPDEVIDSLPALLDFLDEWD